MRQSESKRTFSAQQQVSTYFTLPDQSGREANTMAITESSSHGSDNRSQQLVQSQHNSGNFINMDPAPLDFDECLKDSPRFRQNLKDNLAYIDNLEACITKVRNKINNYIDTGQEHIKSQKDFIQAMRILNNSLGKNSIEISKRVETLLATLEEVMRLQEIVIDQSARTVKTSLNKFICEDVTKIKDARKSFDKIGHEFDQALTKYSQPVKKQQDDSENLLIATSTAFTHTSIDLSIQITTLQSKKGYDILGSLLSFTKAHSTFFHQGSDLFEDLKPHIIHMDEFLSDIQDEFETLVRNLPSKHLLVSNNKLKPLCFDNKAQEVHLEGYLFKRASNGFKVWNRRWFILKDHQLLYQKRGDTQPTMMEEDLRLLTVKLVDKADNDRRFCFEVLSPHKSHILQADSEAACKTWISAIQAGINAAFHDTEYRTIIVPKSNSSNEITTSTANTTTSSSSITTTNSSWGSSFSFKALQQQATSRINSIATSNEAKELKLSDQPTSNKSRSRANTSDDGDDDNDDDDDQPCKVDEQGRFYAPLRDDDDVDDEDKHKHKNNKTTRKEPPMSYPAPADNIEERSTTVSIGDAPTKPQRAYMIILAMPGNDQCADCGAQQPKWASINLGITLCIECAGIHRSLGVHLSKVRSLTLDTEVWSPEIVKLMLSLGNNSVNSAYLSCFRNQMEPINADSTREQREAWIKGKYLLKSFMKPPGDVKETANDKADANPIATKESIEKDRETGATNSTEPCLDKT